MRERQLKRYLGLWLIFLHLGMLALAFICFLQNGFDLDQFTTLVAVIAPMFGCYAEPAIRSIISDRYIHEDNSAPVRIISAGVSFALPFLLAVVVAIFILLQASGRIFTDFSQFTLVLLFPATLRYQSSH
jgi:hypothetical protein